MKNKFSLGILAVGLLSAGVLAGCNKNNSSQQEVETDFSFTVSLSTGSKTLNKGDTAFLVIDEFGGSLNTKREYEIASSDPSICSVTVGSESTVVTALKKGNVRINVEEKKSETSQSLSLVITDADPANGGFNYASLTGDTAVTKRTEILGQLEKYAMDNHLTGITLFENGGYVKYSSRVTLPTREYVTGYGFGLLSEGTLNGPLEKETIEEYKMYLHSSTSAPDPSKINARDDQGSQVSDLEGYITSSFWGTKLNSSRDGYVWYPVLAKDEVTYNGNTTAFNRPIPMYMDATLPEDDPNYGKYQEVAPGTDLDPLGLYNTWRIYVKTGTDGGVKFRYNGNSWGQEFDNKGITIDDYEFAYRFLLTGSHKLYRGKEMANDETYGILGARRYFTNTNNTTITDAEAKDVWDNMKSTNSLGIKTGHDDTNGDYIQLTLLNPIDRFTAMYTLSSNLLSPMSEDFLVAIGGGDSNEHAIRDGAKRYGKFNNNNDVPTSHQGKIVDFVLSVGPYFLEKWDQDQAIYYKKNADWFETGRYNIAGVKLLIIDSSKSITAVYDKFNNGEVDSCGVPSKPEIIKKELAKQDGSVLRTKGDSTFKLNVNSCTEASWDEKFGHNGKISPDSNWDIKPWMSNDNFLNGLFFSIDRKTFADTRGMQPSINYFSNAYLSDPEKGISYNDSEAHQQAIADYQTYDADGNPTYGYSYDRAVLSFQAAVQELKKSGAIKYGKDKDHPQEIHIHIRWMYESDVDEYGQEIAGYFTKAFNDERVSGGLVKLVVDQEAVTKWDDVYYEWLMKGQFDLGFGAISGNTYNPLNFLEVLKSNNSSGFTLNWGTDTSKITRNKPLIYEDKMWSFDALWAVADHGGVVDNGSVAKTVETCYMVSRGNDFYNGKTFQIATKFIDADSAKLDVTRIQLYVYGVGPEDLKITSKTIAEGMVVCTITISEELATKINNDIRHKLKYDDPDKAPTNPPADFNTPFNAERYGVYWSIEVSYSLSIKPEGKTEFGAPTESYVSAAKNSGSWIDED